MVVIPFSDFASFEQELTLDNVPYVVLFNYNTGYGFWTIAIKKSDQSVLLAGTKLVLDYNLLEQYAGRDLPPGNLYVIDTTETILKIDRDNILEPLAIVYITEDEVDTIQQSS